MTTLAVKVDYNLIQMTCGSCGVVFAIPQVMYDDCHRLGGFWHCPNGHQRGWQNGAEKTEILELKRKLEAEERRTQAALTRANESSSALVKAERSLKRHKTRVANGVCPCCQRSFKQLKAHMKNKHPDFITP